MKRLLPFIIILAVPRGSRRDCFVYETVRNPGKCASCRMHRRNRVLSHLRTGAEPPHTIGPLNAPAQLEEFGDSSARLAGWCIRYCTHIKEWSSLAESFSREFPPTPPTACIAAAPCICRIQESFGDTRSALREPKGLARCFDVRPIFEDYAKRMASMSNATSRNLTVKSSSDDFPRYERGHSLV